MFSKYVDAMKSNSFFKKMLPSDQLLRLFMTIPVSSATSERYFSAMKRPFTYLYIQNSRNLFKQLSNVHVHKEVSDSIDLIEIIVVRKGRNILKTLWYYM